MAPKIFITGGTGYIGGSVLHTIVTNHPDYEVTALLRKTPETFSSKYPNVKVIKGDYDSTDILSGAAEKADIVIHNGDSDHVPSLRALLTGLERRTEPSYLLHLSGTGIVSDWENEDALGVLSDTIWSDLSSLSEIRSVPDTALHYPTEALLHKFTSSLKSDSKINIAIVTPSDIYGRGLGPGKTSSALVPFYVDEILGAKESGKGKDARPFYYRQGTNTRGWIHIRDLMRVYDAIVSAAASSLSDASKYNPNLWNTNGYFIVTTQERSQLDVARAVGSTLAKHKLIDNPEPHAVSLADLDATKNFPGFPNLGRYLYASNSRARAERAKQEFGFEGMEAGLLECVEDDVLDAIRARGVSV